MKRYWPIALIVTLIAFLVYSLLLITPKFSGKVFTSQGKDTIPLSSVLVKLIIDQPDTGGVNYNNEYKTRSDSSGAFVLEIGYVPYIANYSLIFSKKGYDTLIFRKTLRRSKDKVIDANLYHKVNEGNNTHVVGSFDSSISYFDPEPEFVMFLMLSLAILIFLVIRYNLFQTFKDQFSNLTRKRFTQLKKADQKAILGKDAFCENCQANNGMSMEHEEHIHGMVFLHGKCDKCENKIKIRWK